MWNKVTNYITNPNRTKEEVLKCFSPNALHAIISQPVADSLVSIVNLFKSLKDEHDYRIEKNGDTVYVNFDPDAEIAGGPFFDLIKRDTFWQIIDVRFGK